MDKARLQVFACLNQGFLEEEALPADPQQFQMMKQDTETG
jgi:hypothetical protein